MGFYLIVQPTRVVENQTPSLIDNIFCNNLSNDIISGNIYLTLSEHFCQFASIKSQKLDIKKITIYARDYSKFSSKDFIDDVAIQNWNYEEEEPSNLFDDFLWKLDGYGKTCSDKKIKTKRDKVEPWINANLFHMIRMKNKLFEREKRQPNNENVKILYNLFRNKVNRELIKSKKSYYATFFENHCNNIKKNMGRY